MAALRVVVPKSSFAPSVEPKPPSVLPKQRPELKERRVFLVPEAWDEIDEAAEFHSDAYAEMGIKQVLASNQLTAEFLEWALRLFWQAKGGRPKKGSAEWKKKVAAFALELRAGLDAKKSDDSQRR
jgi:hypothetical protein